MFCTHCGSKIAIYKNEDYVDLNGREFYVKGNGEVIEVGQHVSGLGGEDFVVIDVNDPIYEDVIREWEKEYGRR